MRSPLTSRSEEFDSRAPLLFRAADLLRLEGVVAAVTQDGMSLALLSRHEAILDHYGKILVERLRAVAPEIGIEIYFPASAEALLARFNAALSDYTVQQAMEANVPIAPPKIWIVHDASALPDHEIQLLARLVQHFPGANIRVVMLLPQGSKKQKLLISFGRRILNWEIDPPTPEQADNMLAQAQVQGGEGAVRALLQKIAVPLSAPAKQAQEADTQDEPPLFAPTPAAPSAPVAPPVAPAPPTEEPAAVPAKPKASKSWMPWFLGIGALLVVSAASVAILHREAVVRWLGGARHADAPSAAAAPPAPAASPSTVVAPVPVTGVTVTGPSTSAVLAASAASPSPAAVVAPPQPERSAVSEEVVIAPAQIRAGQSWVQQMPAGTFLVQHVIVPSYTEANQWMQAHTNLKRAHLVAFYLPNDSNTQYCVVSGPFESLAQASAYVQNPNVPRGSQVRSARYMKEQFTPESANAYAEKRLENRR